VQTYRVLKKNEELESPQDQVTAMRSPKGALARRPVGLTVSTDIGYIAVVSEKQTQEVRPQFGDWRSRDD
jgi:hypothetical protein